MVEIRNLLYWVLCKKRSFKRENKLNDTNNPNIDSDVQPKKQEWTDRKERNMDYIRYADTIDNICISVLVTEMAIEIITVFIMFGKRWNKTGSTLEK